MNIEARHWLAKPLSLFMALVLASWPLPVGLGLLRPDWVFLVVLFWVLRVNSMSLGLVWVIGVFVDVQMGTVLGMHALAMSVVSWLGQQIESRLRGMSPWQTAVIVGFFDTLYRLVNWLVMHAFQTNIYDLNYFWPVLTTMLVWPILLTVMRLEGVRI